MGALSDDGRDGPPGELRILPKVEAYYERWIYHVPPNPPQWSRMGPNERAEWEKARELVKQYNALLHEMRVRGVVKVDSMYFGILHHG